MIVQHRDHLRNGAARCRTVDLTEAIGGVDRHGNIIAHWRTEQRRRAESENIQLLDWSGFSASCPGDCFEDDGFHLKSDGRVYYSALIAGAEKIGR